MTTQRPDGDPAGQPEIRELLDQTSFLRGLARSLTADPHVAEDIVQDTWVSALRLRPGQLKSPRAYLATIARHVAANRRRSTQRRTRREAERAQEPTVEDDPSSMDRDVVCAALIRSVMDLPEKYRSVLLLRYYEDCLPSEIGKRLDLPVETVRTRLKRGMALLRAKLTARLGKNATLLGLGMLAFPSARRMARMAVPALPIAAGLAVTLGGLSAAWLDSPERFAKQRSETEPLTGASLPISTEPDDPLDGVLRGAEREVASRPTYMRFVLDETSQPIPQLKMTVTPLGGEERAAVTQRSGLVSLLPGEDELFVKVELGLSTMPQEFTVREESSSIVELEDGARAFELRLPASYVMSGVVRDQNDLPVPGARIVTRVLGGRTEIVADVRGRFYVPGLDALVGLRSETESLGAARELRGDPLSRGNHSFDLSVYPARVAKGRVVDERGRPVRNARVTLTSKEVVRPTAVEGLYESWIHRWAATDAEGAFQIRHFSPSDEPLAFVADAEGYKRTYAEFDEASRIVLHGHAVMHVEVVDELGDLVDQAEVVVHRSRDSILMGHCGAKPVTRESALTEDGACSIVGLNEGEEVFVTVAAKGFNLGVFGKRAVSNEVHRFQLERPRRVEGAVAAPGRVSFDKVSVMVQPTLDHAEWIDSGCSPMQVLNDAVGRRQRWVLGEDRTFSVPVADDDLLLTSAKSEGNTYWVAQTPAAQAQVVQFDQERSLHVFVSDDAGPLELAQVRLYSRDLGLRYRARTRDGACRFFLPEADDYLLIVKHPGRAFHIERVDLSSPGHQERRVELLAPRTTMVHLPDVGREGLLQLKLTDVQGGPVLGQRGGTLARDAFCLTDQRRIRLHRLPATPVRFELVTSRGSASLLVDLSAEGNHEVDLTAIDTSAVLSRATGAESIVYDLGNLELWTGRRSWDPVLHKGPFDR